VRRRRLTPVRRPIRRCRPLLADHVADVPHSPDARANLQQIPSWVEDSLGRGCADVGL
jgi:hypothetical protein